MNRLWVRLSIAFGLFVLLGPLLLGSIGLLATRPDTLLFFIRLELVSPGSLTDQLSQYYRQQGGWSGVEDLIQAYDLSLPRGPEGRLFSLTFLDEGENVLYGGIFSENLNDESEVRETRLPIVVDGRTRGYLIVLQGYTGVGFVPSADSQTFLLRQVSTALVGLALAALMFGLDRQSIVDNIRLGYGEVAQGAGELGFFNPRSIWPILVAAGGAAVFAGMAVGVWLFLIGLGLIAFTSLGLLFEHYRGDFEH